MNPKKWLRHQIRQAQLAHLGRFGRILQPKKWLFIIGCYNSGTTLLHDVLASLPQVARLPREGQYCTDQLVIPSTVGLARAWALQPELFTQQPDDAATHRLQRQWCGLMSPTDADIYMEKSIPNAARIPWLDANFPNSHFIAIVRNGFVVAEGIQRKSNRSLKDAAHQWAQSNDIMLRDLEAVKHAQIISYEDFTAASQKTIEQLLSFLELPIETDAIQGKHWQIHGVKSDIRNMNHKSLQKLDVETGELLKVKQVFC